eukprot:9066915-Pyramimonas_sp.AAC.1
MNRGAQGATRGAQRTNRGARGATRGAQRMNRGVRGATHTRRGAHQLGAQVGGLVAQAVVLGGEVVPDHPQPLVHARAAVAGAAPLRHRCVPLHLRAQRVHLRLLHPALQVRDLAQQARLVRLQLH